MATQINERAAGRVKLLSRYAGVIVAVIGGLALAGWIFDVPSLKSVFPGLATMKANTAFSFILSGLAVSLISNDDANRRKRWLIRGCATFVALLGLLTLGEYILGQDLGIDQFVFKDLQTSLPFYPGRMSITTSLNFVLISLALFFGTRQNYRLSQFLGVAAGSISYLALIGYIFDVESLYRVTPYSSMALHTALGFVLLALGIFFARADQGWARMTVANNIGGYVLQRLLPIAFGAPLLVGLLRLQGERLGLYGTSFGLALMVISMTILLSVVSWWTAGQVEQVDIVRGEAEDALKQSELDRAAIVENSEDAIMGKTLDGIITSWNKGAERLYGYTGKQVIGRSVSILMPPDRFDELTDILNQIRRGTYVRHQETVRLRKDGKQIDVSVTISPIKDSAGTIIGASSIARDITERKKAEEEIRRLNAELEDRVKLRTAQLESANQELEAFSYSVSHDLRAPLRSIDGFSRILIEDYAPQLDSEAKRYLNIVRTNTRQMGQLIDDLLTFSRVSRQDPAMQTIRLEDLVNQVLAMLRPEQEGRQVEISIGDLPLCQGDPALLKQVFVNLLSNGLKFTRKREVARLEVGSTTSNGENVYFVKDNGAGFDMQYAQKLFGVFQRLHRTDEFEGTGVGLAIVQRIIHRHGGRIWAEAEVDRGATFYFTLPTLTRPGSTPAQLPSKEESVIGRANELI